MQGIEGEISSQWCGWPGAHKITEFIEGCGDLQTQRQGGGYSATHHHQCRISPALASSNPRAVAATYSGGGGHGVWYNSITVTTHRPTTG